MFVLIHQQCEFLGTCCDDLSRYLLLFVVREDRLGGGYSTLIDTEVLLRYLSRSSLFTLMHSDFELRVPPEFFKGEATLVTPLISLTEKRFQYRFVT